MNKIEAGRRQLGAAMELFLREFDPVAVHCLACGGRNVLADLVDASGLVGFKNLLLEEHPEASLKHEANKLWNALKHADKPGKRAIDEQLLAGLDDTENDHQLFWGWFDYAQLTGKLPPAAQVFQIWHFAVYRARFETAAMHDVIDGMFPDLAQVPRREQKRRLKLAVEKQEARRSMREFSGTESRPLTVRA